MRHYSEPQLRSYCNRILYKAIDEFVEDINIFDKYEGFSAYGDFVEAIKEVGKVIEGQDQYTWYRELNLPRDIRRVGSSENWQMYDNIVRHNPDSSSFDREYRTLISLEFLCDFVLKNKEVLNSGSKLAKALKKLRKSSGKLRELIHAKLINTTSRSILNSYTKNVKASLDTGDDLMKAIVDVEQLMDLSPKKLFERSLVADISHDDINHIMRNYVPPLDEATQAVVNSNMPNNGLKFYDSLERLKHFCDETIYMLSGTTVLPSPMKVKLSALRKQVLKKQEELKTPQVKEEQVLLPKVETHESSLDYTIERISEQTLQVILDGTSASIEKTTRNSEGILGRLLGGRSKVKSQRLGNNLEKAYKQQLATFQRLQRDSERISQGLLQAKREQCGIKQQLEDLRLSITTGLSTEDTLRILEAALEEANKKIEDLYKEYTSIITEVESLDIEANLRELSIELQRRGLSVSEIQNLESDSYTRQGVAMSGGGSGGYSFELDESSLPVAYAVPTAPVEGILEAQVAYDSSMPTVQVEGVLEVQMAYDPSIPVAQAFGIVEGEDLGFDRTQRSLVALVESPMNRTSAITEIPEVITQAQRERNRASRHFMTR